MSSVVVIVASALCFVGASATLALALGRAAARGDEDLARELDRSPKPALLRRRQSYAGLGTGQAGDEREPSLLYDTFSVPSMPAWRWPGTEQ